MSVKDFFDKGYSISSIRETSQDRLREDIESKRYVEAYIKRRDRHFPNVDFTTASNFSRFGSAELYYDDTIRRIYQTYPYDGSLAEKIEWENSSTYFDLHLFENEYPRTNGFVSFNSASHTYTSTNSNNIYSSSAPQYILFKGGPNADSNGNYKKEITAGPSSDHISKANIFNTASQHTNNLELDLDKGLTVEFWMKKDGWVSTDTTKIENIFHLAKSGSTGETYGQQLRISTSGQGHTGDISFEILSGSVQLLFTHNVGSSTLVADGLWHHYAFTAKTKASETISNLYIDGTRQSQKSVGSTINAVSGPMRAALGALCQPDERSSTQYADEGWGNIVSSSFDEFRYWKTERTAQQIGRFWKEQVGGGTNTDDIKYDKISNPVDLGVYYKFNEGKTGVAGLDSSVLDYSGRVTNGNFINYTSVCRDTGSAMTISGKAEREFKDPIIYSSHPDVVSLISDKQNSGSMHDYESTSALVNMLPAWIIEEDEEKSSNLKNVLQIIGSFFDDLYLQIESLPRLRDINYPYDAKYEKPLPFADRLLTSRGFDAPELFADASLLAKYLERGEKVLFEKKLYEVKNTIYQNIYNNLSYIQKSKGTLKSIRNFLRCFGVDEELIKLNIYANNETFKIEDNHTYSSLQKRYIDFDDSETRFDANGEHQDSFTATAYQYWDSKNSNSLSYIPAVSEDMSLGSSLTIQADVLFPKRKVGDTKDGIFPGNISSIFGLDTVEPSNDDLSYAKTSNSAVDANDVNINITAVKSTVDKRNASFHIAASGAADFQSADIESDTFLEVYDNERWNFAFRVRPEKYPLANVVEQSLSGSNPYVYELYGVSHMSNVLQNEFTISGSLTLAQAKKFFTNPKRLYVGAKRENFTGSLLTPSDVKVTSLRFWFDYLSDDTIKGHSLDASTYGASAPGKNSNFYNAKNSLFNYEIPQIETLALNWQMDNITGSDDFGRFKIQDFSSGSATAISSSHYGALTSLTKKFYPGRGDKFIANSDQAIDIDFLSTSKLKLPEVVNSDDMVKVLSQFDDVTFTRDTNYIRHFFAVEKSMYQTISQEMLRYFATVADFNNLIGEPVNRYRTHYKRMEKLRDLFFSRVEEDPDLDKFLEFYTWIDNAVSMMISQLIPVSANSAEFLRNMVESHILERNKYWSKFPTLEIESREPFAPILGVNELLYNWKFGHAPLPATATALIRVAVTMPANGETVTLTDADGNTVVYKFDHSSDTADGSLHSDGSSVNVGISSAVAASGTTISSVALTRLASAINATTEFSNGKTLNIEAESFNAIFSPQKYETTLSVHIGLRQKTAGTAGNTSISSNIDLLEVLDHPAPGPGNFPKGLYSYGHPQSPPTSTGFQHGSGNDENQNRLWWEERADRTNQTISSSVGAINTARNTLLRRKTTKSPVLGTNMQITSDISLQQEDTTKYSGSSYVIRALNRPYKLEGEQVLSYKGGANPTSAKKVDFYKGVTKFSSDDHYIFLDKDNEIDIKSNLNEELPDEHTKKVVRFNALTQIPNELSLSHSSQDNRDDTEFTDTKSTLIVPFSIYSGSVETGYQKHVEAYMTHVEFANMHHDAYGNDAEIPMQGPFTEKYVGGNQHRHVNLNINATDHSHNRAEAWHMDVFSARSTTIFDTDFNDFFSARSIDTTDGFVSIADHDELSFGANATGGATATLSYSLWFYPTRELSGYMLHKYEEYGIQLKYVDTTASIEVRMFDNDNNNYYKINVSETQFGDTIDLNKWNHLVFTWNDGSSSPNLEHTVYLNGNKASATTTNIQGTFASVHNRGRVLKIGGFGSSDTTAGTRFNGLLDEISAWDVVLTEDDVTKIYNDGYPTNLTFHDRGSNLVAWWRPTKTESTTLPDVISDHEGTLVDLTTSNLVSNTPSIAAGEDYIGSGKTELPYTGSYRTLNDYDYWNPSGGNAAVPWNVSQSGPAPGIPNTGPQYPYHGTGYAIARVSNNQGKNFGLITPLIDGSDAESQFELNFHYHMYGPDVGTFKVQHSQDRNFAIGVTDLLVDWNPDGGGATAFFAHGQQQTSSTDAWKRASVDLADYNKTRFYLRFLYESTALPHGDVALDEVVLTAGETGSFRILDPGYRTPHKPRAIYTRSEYAKRPVNIRNIEMTGASPTKAGNYLNRYEYLNVVGTSANDPWFREHHQLLGGRTASLGPINPATGSSITRILQNRIYVAANGAPISSRSGSVEDFADEYTLQDRSFLSGTIKNRTRFVSRFSSPGDHETLSRGYLDINHEVYSVYNAMPYRNRFIRQKYNSQVAAHMGLYGVSTHQETRFGTTSGSIQNVAQPNQPNNAYGIRGEPAVHKYPRNTLHRLQHVAAAADGAPGDISAGNTAATATITAVAEASLVDTKDFTLTNAAGVTITFNFTGGKNTSTNSAAYDATSNTTVDIGYADLASGSPTATAYQILTRINAGTGIDMTAQQFGADVVVTQDTLGSPGNRTNTDEGTGLTVGNFTGGNSCPQTTAARLHGTPETGSVHDNGFISHMIPRTDSQYTWITGSLIS